MGRRVRKKKCPAKKGNMPLWGSNDPHSKGCWVFIYSGRGQSTFDYSTVTSRNPWNIRVFKAVRMKDRRVVTGQRRLSPPPCMQQQNTTKIIEAINSQPKPTILKPPVIVLCNFYCHIDYNKPYKPRKCHYITSFLLSIAHWQSFFVLYFPKQVNELNSCLQRS